MIANITYHICKISTFTFWAQHIGQRSFLPLFPFLCILAFESATFKHPPLLLFSSFKPPLAFLSGTPLASFLCTFISGLSSLLALLSPLGLAAVTLSSSLLKSVSSTEVILQSIVTFVPLSLNVLELSTLLASKSPVKSPLESSSDSS